MTEILLSADPLLHLLGAVAYAVAFVLLILQVVLAKRSEAAVVWSGAVGLVLHVAGIVARWAGVGHGPFVSKYENLSSYAVVTGALALYLLVRRSSLRQVGLVLYPAAFLLLGLGLYSGPVIENLPPTFTGIWLVLHVCFYFLAFGTALTALGASVLLMAENRVTGAMADRLPDREELDRLSYRYAGLAFSFWGIGMLTGAIWAFNAWGRYWAWDPVETWSLVTWLVFGIYLHLRRFFGWEGRRAAWLMVLSFAFALMSLFGTTLLENSLHSVYFR